MAKSTMEKDVLMARASESIVGMFNLILLFLKVARFAAILDFRRSDFPNSRCWILVKRSQHSQRKYCFLLKQAPVCDASKWTRALKYIVIKLYFIPEVYLFERWHVLITNSFHISGCNHVISCKIQLKCRIQERVAIPLSSLSINYWCRKL